MFLFKCNECGHDFTIDEPQAIGKTFYCDFCDKPYEESDISEIILSMHYKATPTFIASHLQPEVPINPFKRYRKLGNGSPTQPSMGKVVNFGEHKNTDETDEVPTFMNEHFDVAVITALREEFDGFAKCFGLTWEQFNVPNDPITYNQSVFEFDGKEITIVAAHCLQMGMVASTALTTKMITNFSPKLVAMTGICGGYRGHETNFGDIIIAELSWNFESGKYSTDTERKFEIAPVQERIKPLMNQNVNNLISRKDIISAIQNSYHEDPKHILKVKLGAMACGSAVIADKIKLDEIKDQQRQVLGVDMESYGVMYTANSHAIDDINCLVIKSISDFADEKKDDAHRKYALYTSNSFLKELLKTISF